MSIPVEILFIFFVTIVSLSIDSITSILIFFVRERNESDDKKHRELMINLNEFCTNYANDLTHFILSTKWQIIIDACIARKMHLQYIRKHIRF